MAIPFRACAGVCGGHVAAWHTFTLRLTAFLTPINALLLKSATRLVGCYHNTNSRPFSVSPVNSTPERWSRKGAKPMKAILRSGVLALAFMLALTVPASAGPFEDGLAAAMLSTILWITLGVGIGILATYIVLYLMLRKFRWFT